MDNLIQEIPMPFRASPRLHFLAVTLLVICSSAAAAEPIWEELLRAALTPPAHAAARSNAGSGCSAAVFAVGVQPKLTVVALGRDTTVLCSSFFTVLYSGVTLTPVYSAEHLTAASVDLSRVLVRKNRFHADDRLGYGQGPQLTDYARSGFDRGHMSPNGDMPDVASQDESFALTNMIPQNADNNRGIWAGIEASTREMAHSAGEAFVVTGPAYLGDSTRIGNVAVPSYLWKAIYFPKNGAQGPSASAWITHNGPGRDFEVVSIAELTKRVGVDPFPGVSASIKGARVTFLPPSLRSHSGD